MNNNYYKEGAGGWFRSHFEKGHHSNIEDAVANSSGAVIQRLNYSAFGVITKITNAAGTDNSSDPAINIRFTYTGREYDEEIKLYYYRARYYDPSSGRFLQTDPEPGKLSLPSTFLSKYIYTGNNPAMFSDPSGLSWLSDVVDGVLNFGHNAIAAFGGAIDTLLKNEGIQKLLVLAVAAAFAFALAPAIVAAFGITGGGAIAATALWGGVVGGIVGGVGFTTFGLGTFSEGFQLGAIVGSIAGGFNYGTSSVDAFLSTTDSDLTIRIFAYGAQALGWAEPLILIPTWWSCKDPSGSIGTSGVLGKCDD